MSQASAPMALRRAALVARAAEQRALLARQLEPWRRPLAMASRGLSMARSVASHPAWLIGATLLPAGLTPGRLGLWLRRGLVAVQLVRQLRPGARKTAGK